jgi:MFS family permease
MVGSQARLTAVSRQLVPLRNPGFRLLAIATLGSSVGTLLAAIALAIDIKDRTNSGLWVGAVLVVAYLPTVVVGLTLGPLLDRLRRRNLMIGADLVRAAVFFTLPFTSGPSAIVALAAVAGLANGFFRPAVYAGVPNLVSDEELPAANALLQAMENVSWAIGPVLGGLLTAAAGPHTAYWINGVSFLVSAVLISRIPARMLQSETALTRGHWRDLGDGFLAVVRSRPLLAVLGAWGVACFGIGAANTAEIFLAKNTFHAGDFGYGLIYGAIGGGLVLGSFLGSTLLERIGPAKTYAGGLVLMAVGFGGAAVSPDIWVAAACAAVGGAGDGAAIVCNAVLVQRGSADAMRGRALTLVMSATFLATAAANVVAGALLRSVSPRWIWAGAAVTYAVAAVVGYVLAREPESAAATVEPAH